jgi:hypothetical protein
MVESIRRIASLRIASLRIASHWWKVHAYLRRFASHWWKVYTHFGRGLYGKATRKSVSSATQKNFVHSKGQAVIQFGNVVFL